MCQCQTVCHVECPLKTGCVSVSDSVTCRMYIEDRLRVCVRQCVM